MYNISSILTFKPLFSVQNDHLNLCGLKRVNLSSKKQVLNDYVKISDVQRLFFPKILNEIPLF